MCCWSCRTWCGCHNHKRCGISVGLGAMLGKYSGRQDIMLNRIASFRVDGMGILFTILIVEVAVVATCSHSHILDVEYGLQLLVNGKRVVGRLCNTNLPRQAFLGYAVSNHFATNLNHIVLYAMSLEQASYHIATISFSNGRTVEHNTRVGLGNTIVV